MRLLLKTTEGLVKIYWVAAQSNSITGWFSGDLLRAELGIPDHAHFDSHFTYPQDGDFHFSYKSLNDDLEEFVSVYYDRVKIKTIKSGIVSKTEKQRGELNPKLEILVPSYKPPVLNEVSHYSFPLIAFNVFDGSFNLKKMAKVFVEESQIEEDDLVIDVSGLINSSVNIRAMIQPIGYSFTLPLPRKIFSKGVELPNSRSLNLICDYSISE